MKQVGYYPGKRVTSVLLPSERNVASASPWAYIHSSCNKTDVTRFPGYFHIHCVRVSTIGVESIVYVCIIISFCVGGL